MLMLGTDRYELLRNQRIVKGMESLSGYGNVLVELGIDGVIKQVRHHRARLKAGKAGLYYRHLGPLLTIRPAQGCSRGPAGGGRQDQPAHAHQSPRH